MSQPLETLLSSLGFRFGISGPHAARTMMLDELRLLLGHTEAQSSRSDYATAIVDENVLGKPPRKARDLTLRYMSALYSLDTANPIFRALRRLWPLNEAAQPMLALAAALVRDPLLRATQDFILGQPIGAAVSREAVEHFLAHAYPDRFSPASLKSFAQNVAGTWTAAGILSGHRNKTRAQPLAHPESVTLLLFLGYLGGRTGQGIFSSEWTNLLGGSPDELEALTNSASHRGLLVFMSAGGIKEVRFPGYLDDWIRQQEAGVRSGADGAQHRLAAAQDLKRRLELILEGEPPYDIFVRWMPLVEQPIGWNPDLNDGERLNIRPFMTAEVLRHNKKPKLNITWDKDRGKNVESAPWFKTFGGDRINDHHLTVAEKQAAREARRG